MPLNKVTKLELAKASEISEFNLSGNNVSISLADGSAWENVAMLPKPSFLSKPDITDEGRIINTEFKSGVKTAPDNDFYIARLTFSDGSTRIIGTPDFPAYVISDDSFTDFSEITLSFKWKFDVILTYSEA